MSSSIDLHHCEMGTISSRVDGSLGCRFVTAELRPSEVGVLTQLHGKSVRIAIFPEDSEAEAHIEVETQRDKKTIAQRIRAVLFLLWKQDGEQGTFDSYYNMRGEKIIDHLKKQLEQ